MRDLVTIGMKVLEIILITLQITSTICRRKQSKEDEELTSSEESIENLLYFRDCKHKPKEVSTEPPKPTVAAVMQPLRQPECPCPRMCCSMCCECGGMGMNGGKSMFARAGPNNMIMGGMNGMSSMSGMNSMDGMSGMGDNGGMGGMDDLMEPMGMPPSPPHQPPSPGQMPILRTKKKKKMLPMDMSMFPPLGARRGSGFTREHIKKLISQDEDIKKILKDLVKVTMSKVDLVDGVAVPQPMPRRARVQRRSGDNNNGGKKEEDGDDD